MYCPRCGSQIPDGAQFCNMCGAPVNSNNAPYYSPRSEDNGSFGWAVLGFFIPIVGLVLYLVWKTEKPRSAKMAGKGALVSVMIYVIFIVIYFIIIFAMIGALSAGANAATTMSLFPF